MQRTTSRVLGLGAASAVIVFAGAYAIATAATGNAAPAEEIHGKPVTLPVGPTSEPTPHGPAALPDAASDRASEALSERGRDAHAQGPKDEETNLAPADPTDDAGSGPGYGPGVHAGPRADYGPDNHPDADDHPGGDDHPDSENQPDTTNHPGNPAGS